MLWPADAFSALRIVAFLAGILLALGLGIVLAVVAIKIDGRPVVGHGSGELHLTAGLLAGQLLAYLPMLAAALPLLPFAAKRTLGELGLHPPGFRDVGAGIVGAIAMFLAADLAALLQLKILNIESKQKAIELFTSAHDKNLIYGFVLLAVFVAPFVEELIFRGFLFNAILRYAPVWVAAVLSAVIFSASHGDWTALFPLACGGVVLAAVYYRTGSLAASMFTHGFFNLINVALVLLTQGKAA